MRKTFLSIFLVLISSLLVLQTVEARSFAGRGFGMSRAKYGHSYSRNNVKNRMNNSNGRFRGALTGLLLGTVLGSLFFGHGFGSGIFTWFLLGAAVFFIVNLLRRKNLPKN